MQTETMKVQHPSEPGQCMVINRSDFDPSVHALWQEEPKGEEPPASDAEGEAADDLDALSKGELIALAEERGLTVTRADGGDGVPLKDDYVRALRDAG